MAPGKIKITLWGLSIVVITVQAMAGQPQYQDYAAFCHKGRVNIWNAADNKVHPTPVSCKPTTKLQALHGLLAVIHGSDIKLVSPETRKVSSLKPGKGQAYAIPDSKKVSFLVTPPEDKPDAKVLRFDYSYPELGLLGKKAVDESVDEILYSWAKRCFSTHCKTKTKQKKIRFKKSGCHEVEEIYSGKKRITDSYDVIHGLAKARPETSGVTYGLLFFQGENTCEIGSEVISNQGVLYGLAIETSCGDQCHSSYALVLKPASKTGLIWTGRKFAKPYRASKLKAFSLSQLVSFLNNRTGAGCFTLGGKVFDYNGRLLKQLPHNSRAVIITRKSKAGR